MPKILVIPGGGLRGLIPARSGERIAETHHGWEQGADLFSGASTGGIIALALAAGIPWPKVVGLYKENAARIFKDSLWDNLKDLSAKGVSLRGAQYSTEGLKEVLEETFGNLTLGELGTDVLIPAFDLDNQKAGGDRRWKAKFFSRKHDPDELVVDVALRTSAAPTYFPSYQGYVDGGLIANDPSVCALAYALRECCEDGLAALLVDGVKLMVLGTGTLPKFVEGEGAHDWGGLQWIRHLLDLLMDGGAMAPVYQAVTVLNGNYHRLNPTLPNEIALDGGAWKGANTLTKSVRELLEVANAEPLEETLHWLGEHWIQSPVE